MNKNINDEIVQILAEFKRPPVYKITQLVECIDDNVNEEDVKRIKSKLKSVQEEINKIGRAHV